MSDFILVKNEKIVGNSIERMREAQKKNLAFFFLIDKI